MEWQKPFERGAGRVKRARHRHRLQGVRLAHDLARGGEHPCRRQLHVYCSTADMGQGSDTAMAQIAGEVLHMAARVGERGALRHRRHAPTTWRRSARARSSTWATP
jgi:CO/xanthine dehydrogenase Mo-binding subunit